MKINLRKGFKKICPLMFLCATVLTFLPTAFAGRHGKGKKSSSEGIKKYARFTKEEDERLIQLVKKDDARKWSRIASKMSGRSARQCRERYTNFLSPEISQKTWTEDEDQILLNKYEEYGSNWPKISDFLSGRNDKEVKNRCHLLNRRKENSKKHNRYARWTDEINLSKVPEQSDKNPIESLPPVTTDTDMTNASANATSTQVINQTSIQLPPPAFLNPPVITSLGSFTDKSQIHTSLVQDIPSQPKIKFNCILGDIFGK